MHPKSAVAKRETFGKTAAMLPALTPVTVSAVKGRACGGLNAKCKTPNDTDVGGSADFEVWPRAVGTSTNQTREFGGHTIS